MTKNNLSSTFWIICIPGEKERLTLRVYHRRRLPEECVVCVRKQQDILAQVKYIPIPAWNLSACLEPPYMTVAYNKKHTELRSQENIPKQNNEPWFFVAKNGQPNRGVEICFWMALAANSNFWATCALCTHDFVFYSVLVWGCFLILCLVCFRCLVLYVVLCCSYSVCCLLLVFVYLSYLMPNCIYTWTNITAHVLEFVFIYKCRTSMSAILQFLWKHRSAQLYFSSFTIYIYKHACGSK